MRVLKKMALATLVAGCVLNGTALLAAPAVDRQIALQMYTLRNVGTMEQQFSLAQSAGFSAVELVGDQGV
ncbi:sugar phosphate isomerase/epimerase, partial [Pseudomonas fragariae (ex Marin et al. 2024)]